MQTLADLLSEEAKKLDGFVYSSFPYSCGMTEALMHAKKCVKPPKDRVDIHREAKKVTIKIKPRKGSRKRKLFTIRLWVGG